MKKLPLTGTAAISTPCSVIFAAALTLVAFGGAASHAAPQGPAPQAASFVTDCAQVKNAAARQTCSDALKQLADGKLQLSATLMRKAVATSPKEGVPRMWLGRILLRGGSAAAAERELRQARHDGASDQTVMLPLFRAMIALHKENSALSEFPEPAPNAKGVLNADILRGRALALQSLGRVDEAAAAMDRSLSLRRDTPGLLDRAKMATQQNNTSLAGKLIDEAYRLDPKNGLALLAQLQQLERSGDAAKTLAFSDQILKLYPNNIDTKVIRINAFLKLKQDGKAKAEVDSILARSPREPLGRYYQAVLLDRAHDKNAAWQIVIALPPEFVKQHPEFAVSMAQMAFDNGHADTGAGILGSALGAAPDMLDVRLRLAEFRLNQNSPQSAMLLLTSIQDSQDPRVRKLLARARGAIAKNRAF